MGGIERRRSIDLLETVRRRLAGFDGCQGVPRFLGAFRHPEGGDGAVDVAALFEPRIFQDFELAGAAYRQKIPGGVGFDVGEIYFLVHSPGVFRHHHQGAAERADVGVIRRGTFGEPAVAQTLEFAEIG